MIKLIYYRLSIFLGLIIANISFTNCENCSQGDRPKRLGEASFSFTILNSKTTKNLFLDKSYSIDSVRLINNTNSSLLNFKDGINEYSFGIGPIYNTNQGQIGQQVENTFYIYLNRFDTDTLKLSFSPTEGKCYPVFRNYQVFYNQRLITTGQNVIDFSANINKL